MRGTASEERVDGSAGRRERVGHVPMRDVQEESACRTAGMAASLPARLHSRPRRSALTLVAGCLAASLAVGRALPPPPCTGEGDQVRHPATDHDSTTASNLIACWRSRAWRGAMDVGSGSDCSAAPLSIPSVRTLMGPHTLLPRESKCPRRARVAGH